MGLDMYLTGEIFIPNDWEYPKNNIIEDGYRVKGRNLDLGYWRKHPNLHGFIVENFANGIDDCTKINLSVIDMEKIVDAIEQNKLPHTDGFFFGVSYNDTEEKNDSIKIFQNAIKWLQTKRERQWKSVTYRASW